MDNEILELTRFSDAAELATFINDWRASVPGQVVYIKSENGSILNVATLEAETLTDGSIVYNIILRAK